MVELELVLRDPGRVPKDLEDHHPLEDLEPLVVEPAMVLLGLLHP
jgi:hypothetical protein